MVAERFSEFPFAIVVSTPSASRSQAMDFVGTGFVQNVAAQAANGQTADAMVMMMAVAYGVRIAIRYGGRLVYYVNDKAKTVFKEDKSSFEDAVETYELSANVSLQPTPIDTPEKRLTNRQHTKKQTPKCR